MGNRRIPLEPDKYYHIYNHAIGKENLFLNDDNYLFFLKKYQQYITVIADTFAYCLMPNHFHFVVKIKENLSSFGEINPVCPKNLKSSKDVELFLSQTFGNLFNSYTKALNKQQNRKGKLFFENFERKHINSAEYFKTVVHYVHYNPVYHGFVNNIAEWKYSSFNAILSLKKTNLNRRKIIEWFDDMENFIAFHKKEIDGNLISELETY